MGADQQA